MSVQPTVQHQRTFIQRLVCISVFHSHISRRWLVHFLLFFLYCSRRGDPSDGPDSFLRGSGSPHSASLHPGFVIFMNDCHFANCSFNERRRHAADSAGVTHGEGNRPNGFRVSLALNVISLSLSPVSPSSLNLFFGAFPPLPPPHLLLFPSVHPPPVGDSLPAVSMVTSLLIVCGGLRHFDVGVVEDERGRSFLFCVMCPLV